MIIGKWKSRWQQHTTILDVDDISCYATRNNNNKKNCSRNSVHFSRIQTSSKWWIKQLLKTQFSYNRVFIYIYIYNRLNPALFLTLESFDRFFCHTTLRDNDLWADRCQMYRTCRSRVKGYSVRCISCADQLK